MYKEVDDAFGSEQIPRYGLCNTTLNLWTPFQLDFYSLIFSMDLKSSVFAKWENSIRSLRSLYPRDHKLRVEFPYDNTARESASI